MSKCLSCVRGFYEECEFGTGCGDIDTEPESPVEVEDTRESSRKARRHKPDAALKDQQSTGRKRAANLYPLDKNAPCEWRGKVNMGGGTNPILGCFAGMQQARHHGPDYNTLNNDPDNVSRICHVCHNRWHAANDPFKEETYLIQYGHKPKQLGKRTIEHGTE